MMTALLTGVLSALWLGILTSISPCPLTTNIAAVSFIGKQVADIRRVLTLGIVYSLGRAIAYIAVGSIVVVGLLSIPRVSLFLQRYMILILGPVLIVIGMVLAGLLSLPFNGPDVSGAARRLSGRGGTAGAFLMGMLFALSFCPVSAALFFGSLIPLALQYESTVLFPAIYGAGTGIPVLAFAVVIALSARSVGSMFDRLKTFEHWARIVTGAIFIVAGVYLTLRYVFNLW